jgi:hypothetical protein
MEVVKMSPKSERVSYLILLVTFAIVGSIAGYYVYYRYQTIAHGVLGLAVIYSLFRKSVFDFAAS